jgi:hypothetical protein
MRKWWWWLPGWHKKWRIEKRRACRSAIKRYWQICDFPGDPDYLLSMIHKH